MCIRDSLRVGLEEEAVCFCEHERKDCRTSAGPALNLCQGISCPANAQCSAASGASILIAHWKNYSARLGRATWCWADPHVDTLTVSGAKRTSLESARRHLPRR